MATLELWADLRTAAPQGQEVKLPPECVSVLIDGSGDEPKLPQSCKTLRWYLIVHRAYC